MRTNSALRDVCDKARAFANTACPSNGSGRNAYHRYAGRDVFKDDGICADTCTATYDYRAQDFCAGADKYIVLNGWDILKTASTTNCYVGPDMHPRTDFAARVNHRAQPTVGKNNIASDLHAWGQDYCKKQSVQRIQHPWQKGDAVQVCPVGESEYSKHFLCLRYGDKNSEGQTRTGISQV